MSRPLLPVRSECRSSDDHDDDDDDDDDDEEKSVSNSSSSSSGSDSDSDSSDSDSDGEGGTQTAPPIPSSTTTAPAATALKDLEPCYEDFMPDTEIAADGAARGQSDLSAASSTESNSAGLSKESITEILAEALFRAEQRGSSKSAPPSESDRPAGDAPSTLLSDIEQASSGSKAKRKAPAKSKNSGQESSTRNGVSKATSSAQAKRKLANFQKQHKQLASVIEELISQLD